MVGACTGTSAMGNSVLEALLRSLHRAPDDTVTVRLLCCGKQNAQENGQPRARSLAYDTAKQAAFLPSTELPRGAAPL